MKEKKIVVLMGGPSSEREVSLKTGEGIAHALRSKGYQVETIDFHPRSVYQQLTEAKADVVFIALHGKFGEDGTIQGFLDICGIPYTGSGVRTSSVAMDKHLSKELFEAFKIPTPPSCLLDVKEKPEEQFLKLEKLGFPLILKPIAQGSSIGVVKVGDPSCLEKALEEVFQYGGRVLAEKFIVGRELTIPVLEGIGPLPIIEIRPHSGSYDYSSKYTKGMTDYLVPAPIPEETAHLIQEIALKVADIFESRGVIRLDIMLDESSGIPYVLELNTIPGMTETSLVPQSAAKFGLSYEELCEEILLRARHDG